MRRTKLASVAALAAAALTLAACGSSSEPAATPTPSATTSSAAPTSEEPMPAAKDIVDTAVGAGQFTTLATALTAAGLVDTLKGAGPFTVFAPTDDAFAKLPAGTLDTLLADPKGALTKILTYHVVPGKVMAADVVKMDGAKVKTVNGAELTIKVSGSDVMLMDATGASVKVVKTDVTASNGVIHVIDGVLLPSK
ncbi:MAG TPA: fasciclin domain-containing protein [Dermatophilaceae bacterium]|nr:fasciclin domain-containing protein [Dermatophilaceae bacterium]